MTSPSTDAHLAEALASIPASLYWLLGKGRVSPAEPLYAAQLIDPESGIAIAEGEADRLSEAIDIAVAKLATVSPATTTAETP